MKTITAYKLFKLRKNGTLGPLFIHAKQVVVLGKWLPAGCYPTKGFAVRAGWHCCSEMNAPHLSKRGRVWARILIKGVQEHHRPISQGGLWYTARSMKVVAIEG